MINFQVYWIVQEFFNSEVFSNLLISKLLVKSAYDNVCVRLTSETLCLDALEVLDNTIITFENNVISVSANVSCLPGYTFVDGTRFKWVTCGCDDTLETYETQFGLSDCIPGNADVHDVTIIQLKYMYTKVIAQLNTKMALILLVLMYVTYVRDICRSLLSCVVTEHVTD